MSAAEKLNPAVQIKLKVLKGPHAGQSFHLSKSSFTLGRGPENEVVLLNDAQISRQHARLQVVGQDIEILNLSTKNKVLVGTESVQKWKLVNESTFCIGESEIQVVFDLGKTPTLAQPAGPQLVKAGLPVIDLPPVPPANEGKKLPPPFSVKTSQVPQASQKKILQQRSSQNLQPQMNRMMANQYSQNQQPGFIQGSASVTSSSGLTENPKFRFYLIMGIAVLGLVYWLNMEDKKPVKTEIKSTLKYEDEFAIKQNSVTEKELDKKRKNLLDLRNSPTALRAAENFQKGMRDFQLGNYARALDYFQVVLNLDNSHVLARRHLYLSKIRFDEIVKAKLILGESYYQKHNFKMCEAMYQQVMIMLQGKNNDQSFQIAQGMSEKCRLASEGIR